MQNKGLVKLFALLFGLVSVFQLSFTFKSDQIENDATEYSISKVSDQELDFDKKRNQEKINYLDSLSNISVYDILIADYNYDEVKDRAMNLGLDLKGGINVILQISVKDILQNLSNNSKDPIFNQALIDAEEMQKIVKTHILKTFLLHLIR